MSVEFATLKGLTIPEGIVAQISDALGRVLWCAVKKVNVTIKTVCEGISGNTGSITITSSSPFVPDPANPDNKVTSWTFEVWEEINRTIELIAGSTIECNVRDNKLSNRCYINFNGNVVVKGPGSYLYTVTGDVTVKLADRYDIGEYSMITISEAGMYDYYGTITPLSVARSYFAAATIENYALFGGGQGSTVSATVDAYNNELTRTTPTALSAARYHIAAASNKNYALFGGGINTSGYVVATVDAYNNSLTRTTPTALSAARYQMKATPVGDYVLFGGGEDSGFNSAKTVDAYNNSLTRTTPSELSVTRCAATHVGDYALFGGGSDGKADAYDKSLTRTTLTGLSVTRDGLAATPVGDYALFGGGKNSNTYYDTVDAYDESLTRTTPTALSAARYHIAATPVGDYALFGGGSNGNASAVLTTVDAYDKSLTRTTPTALSAARAGLQATSVGNYALFGGGSKSAAMYMANVDVYTIV